MNKHSTLPAILPCLLLMACGGSGGPSEDGGRAFDNPPGANGLTTVAPPDSGDGWAVSTPSAENMDETALKASLDRLLQAGSGGIDGVVVVRNDKLVAEAYYNGYDRDTIHDVRSVTKSITSALAGIAIDRGLFSLNDTIAQHVPNFESYPGIDDRKRSIRIEHLLNMRTGMDCNDGLDASPGNETKMYQKDDWVRFALGIPMAGEPGQAMSYCSAGVMLLGHIISTRAGVKLEDFAATNLLSPLNITKVHWVHSPMGVTNANSAFQLRPRDAAKFGTLYLNGGTWKGTNLVPPDWIDRTFGRDTTAPDGTGYGWLWWKSRFDVRGSQQEGIYASGNGGNFIFVLPQERLVVVINASNYNRTGPSMDFFRINILTTLN